MTDELRIWVGCLACYNEGKLIGKWITLADTDQGDVTPEFIHGHATSHEEIRVMDHEGFEGLLDGEGSVFEFYEAGEVLSEIAELAYLPHGVDGDEAMQVILERLRDSQGHEWTKWTITDDSVNYSAYGGWAEYAEELVTECYDLRSLPSWLRIDWEDAGNTLRSETSSYVERGGRLYIFNE